MRDLVVHSIPRAFSNVRVEKTFPTGTSLLCILEQLGIPESRFKSTVCFIDDNIVPSKWYAFVKPKPGHIISIRALPAGGEEGGFDKGTLRVVATLAFQVAGFAAQASLGPIAGMVVSIAGILLVNALIPPPDFSQTDAFALNGARNRVDVNGTVPVIYGKHRTFPPLIARPFTHISGDDQFLNLLFLIGYGPMKITDMKIGETSIYDYEGVHAQVRSGFPDDKEYSSGFANTVLENSPGMDLIAGNWVQFTTEPDADEISLDIAFRQGLFTYTSSINANRSVDFEVQYRPTGSTSVNSWIVVNSFNEADFRSSIVSLGNDATTARATLFTNLASLETFTNGMITDIQAHSVGDRKVPLSQIISLKSVYSRSISLATQLQTDTGAQTTTRDNLITNFVTIRDLIDGFTEVEGDLGGFEDDYFQLSLQGKLLSSIIHILGDIDRGDMVVLDEEGNEVPGPEILAHSPDLEGMLQSQFFYTTIFGTAPFPNFTFTDRRGILLRRGIQWSVARGQFDVRIRRITPTLAPDSRSKDEAVWSILRSIQHTNPLPEELEIATVALRIKATDQLSGNIDAFNCVADRAVRSWNGSSWDAATLSNAQLAKSKIPAWIFADVLQGKASRYPVADSRLDFARLLEWETKTLADNREFNMLISSGFSLMEVLKLVAAVGRGSFTMRDSLYSVVLDNDQTGTPAQMFTPHNSKGFKAVKPFRATPNELRVHFLNAEAGWQEDEVTVYNEGFNDANSVTYDTLRLIGVTDKVQAWKDGKYYLNNIRLRPETYTLTVDAEHLVCERGDMVLVRNDVTLWGLASARIKTINTSGPNIVSLVLDGIVDYGIESHQIRIRQENSGTISFLDVPIDEVSTSSDVVTFTTPIASSGSNIQVGDMLAVGIINIETVELIIKQIRHQADLEAQLTLVDHSPGVHFLEDIPEFDPSITLPNPRINLAPPTPIVEDVRTDESVLERDTDGSLASRIVVNLTPAQVGMNQVPPVSVQGQYRPSIVVTGSVLAPWIDVPLSEFSTRLISFAPVTDRESYDVRIRYLSRLGVESLWTTQSGIYVIGKTSPPPSPTGLFMDGNFLTWEYPDPPLDFDGFRIKLGSGVNATWENSILLHNGLISGTSFTTNFAGLGPKRIFVKAVDTSGNESTQAAYITIDLGDILPDNVIATVDYRALSFPGTKTNASIVGGDLETDVDGADTFWGNDVDVFWGPGASLFWPTSEYLNAIYEFEVVVDSTNGPARISFDMNVDSTRWSLEYRSTAYKVLWPTPLSLPFWPDDLSKSLWSQMSGWLPWPGSIFAAFGTYKFRLEFDGGVDKGEVDKLILNLDVDDVEENTGDVSISASSTRLPLTKNFREITVVTYDLLSSGTGVGVRTIDRGTKTDPSDLYLANGPDVEVIDDTGATVAGTVRARMKGY